MTSSLLKRKNSMRIKMVLNINSMIYQFNENNDDGLIIFTKQDQKILEEWVKENGWDLK